MRHLIRDKNRRGGRSVALALACALLLAAFPTPPSTARAAQKDGSVTQCTDLNQMFNIVNVSSTPTSISGNTITIRDKGHLACGGAKSKQKISLRTDWSIDMTATLPNQSVCMATWVMFNIFSKDGNVLQFMLMNHRGSNGTVGWHSDPKWTTCTSVMYGAAADRYDFGPGGAVAGYKKNLAASDFGSGRPASLSYHWDDSTGRGTFTFMYNGYTTVYVNDKVPDESAYLSMEGTIETRDLAYYLSAQLQFTGFRYTQYQPTMSVRFLDPGDNTKELHYALPGDTVTVEATAQNIGSTYSFPAALKNSDLNAHVGITPCTGSDQKIYIGSTPVATDTTHDITKDSGIAFSLPTGDDAVTIRYNATVTGDSGTTATVYQRLQDDFFKNNYYHQSSLTVGAPMVSDDEDPDHYDYIVEGPAGENGWYTGTVTIALAPDSTYDELYFDGAAAPSENGQKQFETDTAGTQTDFYGVQTSDGKRSGDTSETLKIDATAPTLQLTDRGTMSFSLKDSLSGVWKLQVKLPGGSWQDLQLYALTDGAGDPVQTAAHTGFTGLPNGTYQYRAVDAAGNASDPVTVKKTDVAPVIVADDTATVQHSAATAGSLSPQAVFDMIAGDDIAVTAPAGSVKTPAVHNTLPTVDGAARIQLYDEQISWRLEQPGSSFTPQTGAASTMRIPVDLPCGKYILTFSQNGVDDDGHTAQPKVCTLYVVEGQAPDVQPGGDTTYPDGRPDTDPDDAVFPPDQPEPDIDDQGQVHRTLIDQITEQLQDPPAGGGRYTRQNMLDLFAGRYQVTSSQPDGLLQWGQLHITHQGQPASELGTTRPGQYIITRTATDSAGNTTTIQLTYTFVERPVVDPPHVQPGDGPIQPDWPQNPDQLPEVTVTPDGQNPTISHALLRDELVQDIGIAPPFGGHLSAQTAAGWFDGRYRLQSALPYPADTLTYSPIQILDSQGRDITALGIDTTAPGSYTIRRTATDLLGNTTTVEMSYQLTQRQAQIEPGETGTSTGDGGRQSGSDGANGGVNTGEHRRCWVHWLALLAAGCTAGYTWLVLRRQDEEEQDPNEI